MDVKAMRPMEGHSAANALPEKNAQVKPVAEEPAAVPIKNEDTKQSAKDMNKQEMTQLSQQLNKFMEEMNAGIQFAVHEKTNSLMVQVIDAKNQRVLKEFPSKEFLDTIANIREYVGFLLDKRA